MIVSVITATYNSYPEISDALKSLSMQEDIEIECIVADGSSNDKTMDVIHSASIVTKFVSETDCGIYDALNKGIRMASGDIIGFLHSDDQLYSPLTLKHIVNAFNSDKEGENGRVDGVYGDLIYVNQSDAKKVIRYWQSNPFKPELLYRGWMPAHPTLFLRREVYEKHGFFDLSLRIAADYDFLLRVFSDPSLRFVYLPEIITKMRVGGASNKSLKNILQKSIEDYHTIRKNNIPNPFRVLFLKNISKFPQFFRKG